jgi:cob(I)alamin adenosyltransferase
VVLDEITYLPKFDIISEPELLAGLRERAPGVHVIVTGRDAGPGLMTAADTATEMRSIRHAFDSDAPARKGIEF